MLGRFFSGKDRSQPTKGAVPAFTRLKKKVFVMP